MTPVPIYILHWKRLHFLERVLQEIVERTDYPYTLNLFVNEANATQVQPLLALYEKYSIQSLTLDRRNTGCLYPKAIHQASTTIDTPYYVVTDDDQCPPVIAKNGCWLTQLIECMNRNDHIGCIAAQQPPQCLQEPYATYSDYIACKAVGNNLKVVRTKAWPSKWQQSLGAYGDDSILCSLLKEKGYTTAFSRSVYSLHLQHCANWGYDPADLHKDPRKAGYNQPYEYAYDPLTYVPVDVALRM